MLSRRQRLYHNFKQHRFHHRILLSIIIGFICIELIWIAVHFAMPSVPQTQVSSSRIMHQVPEPKSNTWGDVDINKERFSHLEGIMNSNDIAPHQQVRFLRALQKQTGATEEKWASKLKMLDVTFPGRVRQPIIRIWLQHKIDHADA